MDCLSNLDVGSRSTLLFFEREVGFHVSMNMVFGKSNRSLYPVDGLSYQCMWMIICVQGQISTSCRQSVNRFCSVSKVELLNQLKPVMDGSGGMS